MSEPATAVRFRPAVEADLDQCTGIWKRAIDDYEGRLNQPSAPDDLSGLRRMLAHFLTTDPERFWVAVDESDMPCGFGSAVVRGDLWFLGMLFVEPGRQATGIGQALLERTFADAPLGAGDGAVRRWGTSTDSVQPISNAVYARHGIVPRVPIWRFVGEVLDRRGFPSLAAGTVVTTFEALVEDGGADGHRRLAELVNGIDREVIGLEHPVDHALLRRDDRHGYWFTTRDGTPLGYGYASAIGRLGPIAARDPSLVAPILGFLATEVPANGARSIWMPGSSGPAFSALLRAGLRLDGFPGLLCWSDAEHPFDRYVPISLALV